MELDLLRGHDADFNFSMWFIAGILTSIMGLVGLYVGKIFDETKSRPAYIVEDQV